MRLNIACQGAGHVHLEQLRDFQGDLKELSKEGYARLRRLIEDKFSFPIAVWLKPGQKLDGKPVNIIEGHQRAHVLRDLQEEGWEIPPLPVNVIYAKTAKEAHRILLQGVSQFGRVTPGGLEEYLQVTDLPKELVLQEISIPNVTLTIEPVEGVADDALPEEVPAVAKRGELWKLGRHRLLCGDARQEGDYARLLSGAREDVVVTDPPYSVGYDKEQRRNIRTRSTAKRSNPRAYSIYLEGQGVADTFQFLRHVAADVVVMTFPVDRHFEELHAALQANAFALRRELIWVKPRVSYWPSAFYQQRHEPVLILVRVGAKPRLRVSPKEDTVLEYDRADTSDHPTARPLALVEKLVLNHSRPDQVVLDPFAGSGTTLLACEKTGRICYAMDLSPGCCDLVIARWKSWCGANNRKPEVKKL